MDRRLDLLTLTAALALSLLVHAALFLLGREARFASREPTPGTVAVQYLPAPAAQEAERAPTAAEARTKRQQASSKPRIAKGRQDSPRGRKSPAAAPKSAPEPPQSAQPASTQPAPSTEQASLPTSPPAETRAPDLTLSAKTSGNAPAGANRPGAAPRAGAGSGPALGLDLAARPEDVAVSEGSFEAPDPSGPGAKEATLGLRQRDLRYRSYLDLVQDSIDGSWRWKEALISAGRSGSVLVRFTLAPGGGLEQVEVEKTSGNPILDGEAVKAVRRSAMPAFPSHWTLARLHLFAQFDYRLE